MIAAWGAAARTGSLSQPPCAVAWATALAADATPPLLVYTDASFWWRTTRSHNDTCGVRTRRQPRGGLGAVVYDPVDGSARYALGEPAWHELLAFWSPDYKTYIAQLEVLAAISAYFTYPELFVGRRVQHFIDNTVALSALVHGYSGKADLAKMVNAFFLQMAGLRASVYCDYVPSKANIADLPSRGALRELCRVLRRLGMLSAAVRVAASFPPLSSWHAPAREWLRMSAPALSAETPRGAKSRKKAGSDRDATRRVRSRR